jgi:hypothetical protein
MINGKMYPALSRRTEDAMMALNSELEAKIERLEEALADTFGAAVAQADLKENNDENH